MTIVKVCRSCHVEKPLSQFYPAGGGISAKKYAPDCKPCAIKANVARKISLRVAPAEERARRTRGRYVPRKFVQKHSQVCRECKLEKPVGDFDSKGQKQSGDTYYHLDCRDCRSKKRRASYAGDPKQQATHRAEAKAYNAKNPELVRAKNDQYRRDNPEVMRANMAKRRAREVNAEGSHTAADIADIRLRQKDRCALPSCRKPLKGRGSLDHRVALKNGGSNWRKNLQLLCRPCNSQKSATDEIVFMQSLGFLM